jgi:hypothetical protein
MDAESGNCNSQRFYYCDFVFGACCQYDEQISTTTTSLSGEYQIIYCCNETTLSVSDAGNRNDSVVFRNQPLSSLLPASNKLFSVATLLLLVNYGKVQNQKKSKKM